MPKVKQDTFNLDGQQFIRVIKVDSSGTFTSDLPPGWFTVLGYGQVRGRTLEECEKAFRKAMDDYRTAKTTKRKVIIYNVRINARVWRHDRVTFSADDSFFSSGCSISIAAGVFIESKFTAGSRENFDYDEVRSTIPRSLQQFKDANRVHGLESLPKMDWTQEREDFFAKLGRSMEEIALMCAKLRADNKSPDSQAQVIALIDSGRFLTMPGAD